MDQEKTQKLKGYFYSLKNQGLVLKESSRMPNVAEKDFNIIASLVKKLDADFPNIVPSFEPDDFYSYSQEGVDYYKVSTLQLYIGNMIGVLQIKIEEENEVFQTEKKEFPFIKDLQIKKIVERDYLELQVAFKSKCWKSVIILSGGIIEALLLDLLFRNIGEVERTEQFKAEPDLTKWKFVDLIIVSKKLKLVGPFIDSMSHTTREYRNLVHPGYEIRENIKPEKEEGELAVKVLDNLFKGLS